MKIAKISINYYNKKLALQKQPDKTKAGSTCDTAVLQPTNTAYYSNISFGLANANKLKILFKYDIPCMYSGIIMIDPQKLHRMLKAGEFQKPVKEVLKSLQPFEKSIFGKEKELYNLIKSESVNYPNLNVQDLLKKISPKYEEELRKKQFPILQELMQESLNLPKDLKTQFDEIIKITLDKMEHYPVSVPFSPYEFLYKILKIKREKETLKNIKAKKVMTKMYSEARKLFDNYENLSKQNRMDIITLMQKIQKTSVLKNDENLKNTISMAQKRLNNEKIIVPFSRKSFIYDIARLFENVDDEVMKQKFIDIARQLPSSQQSLSAYIVKNSHLPSDKIIYKTLIPATASIEHLLPRSCGGANVMANYGGACSKMNSERKSIDFLEQIKHNPQTAENCQKYIDRLIELANSGIFAQQHIEINYIKDFKRAIKKLSNGKINLDISKLKVKNDIGA